MLKLKHFIFIFLFFVMNTAYGFEEGYVEYQRYPFLQNGVEYNIVVLKKDNLGEYDPLSKLPIIITKKTDGEEKEISRMYSYELSEGDVSEGFHEIVVNGEYFTIKQMLAGGWYFYDSQLTFKYIGDDKIILDNYSLHSTDRRDPMASEDEPATIYYPKETIYFEDMKEDYYIFDRDKYLKEASL